MGRLESIIGTEIIKTETDEIRLGHTFYEAEVLKEFILKEKPEWFIEIGVHEGGLSYLLRPELEDLHYLGIELFCDLVRPEVKEIYQSIPYSELICENCFDKKVTQKILLLGYFKKIIYCDGGNKAKELMWFADFCNKNDVILTHDFYDGKRKVRGVPDENISKEVLVSDIQHMENDKTFERLDEDIFKETRIIGWRKL